MIDNDIISCNIFCFDLFDVLLLLSLLLLLLQLLLSIIFFLYSGVGEFGRELFGEGVSLIILFDKLKDFRLLEEGNGDVDIVLFFDKVNESVCCEVTSTSTSTSTASSISILAFTIILVVAILVFVLLIILLILLSISILILLILLSSVFISVLRLSGINTYTNGSLCNEIEKARNADKLTNIS